MPSLLIIGHTYPEPDTTAAGKRMLQLIEMFQAMGFDLVFATTALPTERSLRPESLGITVHSIKLNDDGFNDLLQQIAPQLVLFDRFMTEEQFSWRVAEQLPDTLRLLDTEDLHFLRKAREHSVKRGDQVNESSLDTDLTKRELASILRSDLSLIISEAEHQLLVERFLIPEGMLHYLPLVYNTHGNQKTMSFEARSGYMTIGNFLHGPNADSIYWLSKEIWPKIRSLQPEAHLSVYGSYASESIQDLHDPDHGFHLLGWVPDVHEIMQQARICLAPLRYGAGLKGKILDAAFNGTPVVTTPVGAEGISGKSVFPGIVADTAEKFASEAVGLYSDEEAWTRASNEGIELIAEKFSRIRFSAGFENLINRLLRELPQHRSKYYISSVIWHQSLRATAYMGKWITEKNSKNN